MRCTDHSLRSRDISISNLIRLELQFAVIFIFSLAKFFTRTLFLLFVCSDFFNVSVPLRGSETSIKQPQRRQPEAEAEKTKITFTRFALTFATATRAAAKRRTSAESQSSDGNGSSDGSVDSKHRSAQHSSRQRQRDG